MCTLLFGLTSHLVYTGYVVLGLWLLALLVTFFQKERINGRFWDLQNCW